MRTLHADTLAALADPAVRFIALVRMEFDAGVIAWHTGFNDLAYDGTTYTAAGHLGEIGQLSESTDAGPNSVGLTIGGVDPAVVALFLGVPFVNRPAQVHLAVVDAAGAVIGEPFLLFSGSMDGLKFSVGKTASINLVVRSRLADWERPLVSRYTHQDQQTRHPGDMGFAFVEELATKEILWPGRGYSG